ncbi:Multimodular transpeptidase-transglycosylase [Vulgatibacter incomptus]|uniref:peptidoglycan glycosyltransferase n=1 Tax=Vulgatibacter incomptus TaxID=1391653 RepID=A0A0K1PBH1_9BACT|nr:Multimodular transpeptidase-transglycosylase [Vulgatibacter incomptus]
MRRALRIALLGAAEGALVCVVMAAGFVALPLPGDLLRRDEFVSISFTDREGGILRELRSSEDGRATPLPGGRVPPLVRAAFLAAEDRRFDRHPGVDPLALGRAALQNLRAGRVVSGASTLTQQLARRLVPRPRTFVGKMGEALWAIRLHLHLPREAILREYLDRVPLGNSTFGVEAAAQLYFGRTAERLSAGQAALLAGMAKSPARLDPYRHDARSKARMRAVLARMAELGALSEEQAAVAAETPLDLVPASAVFESPHLIAALSGRLPAMGLGRAVRIQTTIDPALQADVEAMVRDEVAALAGHNVGQAAVVVVDNASGEVLAYVGSADFLDEERQGQNDGVRALRQPGSALKPFVYGRALADGKTAASVLSDVEVHLATPSGDYVPKNYDRRTHGPVRLRTALASSYNVPAIRIADELGPDRALATLRAAGFDSLTGDPSHYGVGIVLGNGDVTLRELARAYRGLALGGVLRPLADVRRAWDAEGRALPVERELEERRFLPAPAVELLTDILEDEGARSPGFGLDNALRLPFKVAAKTGTSRAYVDNWTAGYTAERTVAVWVGNFDGKPMRGVSGITGAGPLFRRAMIRAMRGIHPSPLVDRSHFVVETICPLSGKRAGPACEGAIHEVFLPGTEPGETCPMHRLVPDEGRVGRAAGGGEGERMRPALDVGPGFYGWAHAEGIASAPLGPARPAGDGTGPRFLLPADGDEYLLETGIPLESQAIPIRVVAPAGQAELEVRLDDGSVVPLPSSFTARIPAERGRRRLELWARGGDAPLAVSRFVVR